MLSSSQAQGPESDRLPDDAHPERNSSFAASLSNNSRVSAIRRHWGCGQLLHAEVHHVPGMLGGDGLDFPVVIAVGP